MWEIRTNREMIKEMMKELDERKAIGPKEVSAYILKECKQEMAQPIYDIIKCSLKIRIVLKVWKKPAIKPIFKNRNKEEPFNY